jgi:hypothetical protein
MTEAFINGDTSATPDPAEQVRMVTELNQATQMLNNYDMQPNPMIVHQNAESLIARAQTEPEGDLRTFRIASAYGALRAPELGGAVHGLAQTEIAAIAGGDTAVSQRLFGLLQTQAQDIIPRRQQADMSGSPTALDGNRASFADHIERNRAQMVAGSTDPAQQRRLDIFLSGLALSVAPSQRRERFRTGLETLFRA